ncbi:hypothetical protein BDN72DRAFT_641308 [Pluteus cervinus]|uniref:Uncharacterized protein n=1 Tax=Pluteus cervinus TaxID=181527 RepID=A0ACD3AST5_9AGAR|nr:hypothetical protein BDN72DRAFT_641308 [Pluteus cervinus]
MSLSALPPELLVQLLTCVDIASLLPCRRVCRTFSNVIAAEPTIQYRVDLFFAGMINNPETRLDLPVIRRHQALRDYITRRNLLPKDWLTRAILFDTSKNANQSAQWCYHCGIFAGLGADGRTVRCIRFLDLVEGNIDAEDTEKKPYEEWEYVVSHIPPHDPKRHFMDANQDLLILTEGLGLASLSDTPHLHFLSLQTGKPHPFSCIPKLELGQNWTFSVRGYDVVIYEDLLAIWISFNDTRMVTSEVTTQIEVYNWKTGPR